VLTKEQRAELRHLERALAYSAARSDIECYCQPPAGTSPLALNCWYDPGTAAKDDRETVATALRYLELRGLIERSPQGWVRVRDAA
jgi:hypothetical protein